MSEIGTKAPKEGEYSNGKFWFSRKGSTITLGLTSSAVDEIGQVESVDLPDDGDDFDMGEVCVTIEGSKGTIELVTPAAGIVEEANRAIDEEPDMVSEDPLEEGWLVKIEMQDSTDLQEFIGD